MINRYLHFYLTTSLIGEFIKSLTGYPASLGTKGEEWRVGGVGGEGEGGRGPSEGQIPSLFARAPPSLFARAAGPLPPALPHCLLYFLKLYNVFISLFNDNVQSIR